MLIDAMNMGYGCINCRSMVNHKGMVTHGKPLCSERCKVCSTPCERGTFYHSKGCYRVSRDGGGISICYMNHHHTKLKLDANINNCVEGTTTHDPTFIPYPKE